MTNHLSMQTMYSTKAYFRRKSRGSLNNKKEYHTLHISFYKSTSNSEYFCSAVCYSSGGPISSQSFRWREDKHGSEFPERGIGIDFPLKPALVERERVSRDFISPHRQTASAAHLSVGERAHQRRELTFQLAVSCR